MQPTDPQNTSPFDLHGRLAVVTGVRRGIGLAIAGRWQVQAQTSWASADSSSQTAVRPPDSLTRGAAALIPVAADLGDRAAVQGLLERLAELGRPVDILVTTPAPSTGSQLYRTMSNNGIVCSR